jgi:hypothetical protein
MKKAFFVTLALLLQISYLPLVQAHPEEKAVGKAASYYRHLDVARGGSQKSENDQVAEGSKNLSEQPQVATQQNQLTATATSLNAGPEGTNNKLRQVAK